MPKRSEPSLLISADPAASEAAERGDPDAALARFEQEMQELETIVAQMEKGELRLEDSLKLFERGTRLARSCRRTLDEAELKVRQLLDEPGQEPGPASGSA
jgi:exodeoxyribonuclease VII small subunit